MSITWSLPESSQTGPTSRERAVYAAWVRHANESGLKSEQAMLGWQEVETRLADGHTVDEAFALAVRTVR